MGVSFASTDDLLPLAEAWDAIRRVNGAIPDAAELRDFLCADTDLIVHKEFSDDAIIESVHKEYESDDKSEESNKTQEMQVSLRKVLDAFDIIRTFLCAHDDNEAMQSLLTCEARAIKLLQTNVKHSKISDFFKKILVSRSNWCAYFAIFATTKFSRE